MSTANVVATEGYSVPDLNNESNPGRFSLHSHWFKLPHPANTSVGGAGEDACFVAPYCLGVADGVGGWAAHGIDAGEYSRGLMGAAEHANSVTTDQDPVTILDQAWTVVRTAGTQGSTTAMIVTLDASGRLSTANMGDSGLMVLRPTAAHQILYRSTDQVSGFNMPFQLGHNTGINARDCEAWSGDVKEGDLLILATDGLFDNMFDEEIVQTAAEYERSGANAQYPSLPETLARNAQRQGFDATFMSPFAVKARASGLAGEVGGKLDDICVVVARVGVHGILKYESAESEEPPVPGGHALVRSNTLIPEITKNPIMRSNTLIAEKRNPIVRAHTVISKDPTNKDQ